MNDDNVKPYSAYYMISESDRLWIRDTESWIYENNAILRARDLLALSLYSRVKVIQSDEPFLENLPGIVGTP